MTVCEPLSGTYPKILPGADSGLRRGELLALLWGIWTLRRAVVKPQNSIRKVVIPTELVELLTQGHKKPLDSPYMLPSPVIGVMYIWTQ